MATATNSGRWQSFYVYVKQGMTYYDILEKCKLSSRDSGHDVDSPTIHSTCSNFAAAIHLIHPRKYPRFRIYRADGTYEIDEDYEFIDLDE